VWATLVLLTFGGCAGYAGSSGEPVQDVEEFPILWEKAGSHCGLTQPARLVARTRADMAYCPIGDVPVDFENEMVLTVTMGRVMAEGYAIRIHRVWREGSYIKVDVRIHRPTASTQSTIQLATPYHVVIVPRSDLNVEGFTVQPRAPKPGTASPLFSL